MAADLGSPDESESSIQGVPPQPTGDLVENAEPSPGLYTPPQRRPPHPDLVRLLVTGSLLVILAGTVIGGFVGWLRGDALSDWTGFTTPVFTLAGVAVAFYFSDRKSGSG